MITILCPTRGGEPSYPNQDRAAAIAKERKARLIFLYVSDVEFLNRTASPIVVDVAKELDEMGEFLLAMAQERAGKVGVKAEAIVRRGPFREVLQEVIEEFDAGVLILGSSEEGVGVTTRAYLEDLSREISEESGVEVILLHQGEVITTIKA